MRAALIGGTKLGIVAEKLGTILLRWGKRGQYASVLPKFVPKLMVRANRFGYNISRGVNKYITTKFAHYFSKTAKKT